MLYAICISSLWRCSDELALQAQQVTKVNKSITGKVIELHPDMTRRLHVILNRISYADTLRSQIGCCDLVGQLFIANIRSSGSIERAINT